jgi:gliding motility-associated-like protein
MKTIILFIGITAFNFISFAQNNSSHHHDHDHDSIEHESIDSLNAFLDASRNQFAAKPKSFNCATENFGFESGDATNWTTTGSVAINNAGNDPYGLYPKVFNGGGNFSARLGSDQGQYGGKIARTFTVPSIGETVLSFHFAMAIFNFPHETYQAAKFTVKFYDQNNTLITCPNFECYYSSETGAIGVPNFNETTGPAQSYNPSAQGDGPDQFGVSWSPWNDVSINLSGFTGQTITVVFEAKECIYGPDWCYAYVDVDCPTNTGEVQQFCASFPYELSGPGGFQSYNWLDSNLNTVGSTQNISVLAPGTYQLQALPNASSCAQASTITFNYALDQLPVASFAANHVCLETPVTVVNSSSINSISYEWFWDSTAFTTTQTPQILDNSVGSHNLTLITSSNFGCKDTTSKIINIYPNPIVGIAAEDVCFGNLTSITDSISVDNFSNSSIATISLNLGNGFVTPIQMSSYEYSTDGIYNIILTASSNFGCIGSDTTKASVFQNPTAAFTSNAVCFGDQSMLQSISSSTVGISEVNWIVNDEIATGTDYTTIFSTFGIFPATLSVVDLNGCIDETSDSIRVRSKPVAAFELSNPTGCSPICVNFDSKSFDPENSTLSLQWFENGNAINTSTIFERCYENTSSSTEVVSISLSVVNGYGCSSSSTGNTSISIYPVPTASFTYAPEDLNIFSLETDVTNLSSNGDNYTWIFAKNVISDDFSPTVSLPEVAGTYPLTLIVTTDQGCIDSITKLIKIADELIYYVPNTFTPDGNGVNNTFYPVMTNGVDPSNYELLIFNRWGEMIFGSKDLKSGWDGTYKGQIVNDGTYIWKLKFQTKMGLNTQEVIGHVNVLK